MLNSSPQLKEHIRQKLLNRVLVLHETLDSKAIVKYVPPPPPPPELSKKAQQLRDSIADRNTAMKLSLAQGALSGIVSGSEEWNKREGDSNASRIAHTTRAAVIDGVGTLGTSYISASLVSKLLSTLNRVGGAKTKIVGQILGTILGSHLYDEYISPTVNAASSNYVSTFVNDDNTKKRTAETQGQIDKIKKEDLDKIINNLTPDQKQYMENISNRGIPSKK